MVTATGAAEDSTEKARKVRGWLMDELSGLAKDVKNGKASKEEAMATLRLSIAKAAHEKANP